MESYNELFESFDQAEADALKVRWNIGVKVWNDTEVLGVKQATILEEWQRSKSAVANGCTTQASVSQHKSLVVKFESFQALVDKIKSEGLSYSFESARKLCSPSYGKKAEAPVKRRFSAKREASSLVEDLGADKARKLAEEILAQLG